jgi:hypothetical protein
VVSGAGEGMTSRDIDDGEDCLKSVERENDMVIAGETMLAMSRSCC